MLQIEEETGRQADRVGEQRNFFSRVLSAVTTSISIGAGRTARQEEENDRMASQPGENEKRTNDEGEDVSDREVVSETPRLKEDVGKIIREERTGPMRRTEGDRGKGSESNREQEENRVRTSEPSAGSLGRGNERTVRRACSVPSPNANRSGKGSSAERDHKEKEKKGKGPCGYRRTGETWESSDTIEVQMMSLKQALRRTSRSERIPIKKGMVDWSRVHADVKNELYQLTKISHRIDTFVTDSNVESVSVEDIFGKPKKTTTPL